MKRTGARRKSSGSLGRLRRARRWGGDAAGQIEADGLVGDGWVEWGGELIWAVGFTESGAPFGLRVSDFDAADLEFGSDGLGRFGFIAVQGSMDCREEPRDGRPGLGFTWEGSDDCDHASGRGWAVLDEDGSLSGRIYFHLGDDSGFRAERFEDGASTS